MDCDVASPDIVEIAAYHSQELPCGRRAAARLLVALEEDRTGRQPVNFSSWTDLDKGSDTESINDIVHVFLDGAGGSGNAIGYARVNLASKTAELTMRPDSFEKVSALTSGVQAQFGVERFWAKGRESAAAGLEADVIRRLDIMTRRLSVDEPMVRPDSRIRIRPFNPRTDTDQWLQINATIFSDLPDQASVTRVELMSLLESEWFDPRGFLVAESTPGTAARLTGFHWTKVDPTRRFHHGVSGEVFVLGVLPQVAGTGLATALLTSGLRRIASSGVSNVHLFVESDNKRAHKFYESQDFKDADQDLLLQVRR